VFDPRTLPAAKLWTQVPPVTPEQYYQHFEIWTATSAVMEDPVWQAELSSYAAGDSWQQVWGIGGYVLANEDLAMNLERVKGGKLLAGVCGTRKLPGCVVSLRRTDQTLLRRAFDLDPAQPWRGELPDGGGRDVTMEVFAPDGAVLARYELRDPNALPKEQWQMPAEPRWQKGVNSAVYEEGYSPLWRRPDQFLDEAIRDYGKLLKDAPAGSPQAVELAVALARSHLKDEQVRIGAGYRKPGPEADADAAKRREADLEKAVELLEGVLKDAPAGSAASSATSQAWLYLGLALERQGKRAEAVAAYRAALKGDAPATAAGVWLARLVMATDPAEAAALAQRAAQQHPQSIRARHVLLAALQAAGRLDQAADVGAKLLARDATDPLTTRLLADLAAKAGRAAEGKAYEDRTARLLAGDDKAAKALEADLRWVKGQ
jgi:tetratricopeptide (TPR) repeat protein